MRARGPVGGGGEAAEATTSRSGGASGRSGLTGLGPDETGECSPNSGLPGSDPSEKARRVRERRGDAGGGEEDEEEEDAIVAEGGRPRSEATPAAEEDLGARAPTEEGLGARRRRRRAWARGADGGDPERAKRGKKARGSSERACLEKLKTCRNKREPFVRNVGKA